MKKRMFLMLVVMAVFVSAIGAVKYKQVKKSIAQHASFQPPPEAVTTIVTKREEWPVSLDAIGTAVAVHGVTVSADLPGIVDKISIDSGKTVRQGAVLVTLDTREARAQLAAAQAQQKWAQISIDRYKGLLEKGVLPQADYDKAAADDAQARARVVEIRATIERKTIRAPFSGVLGIRQVNLGQYLAGGAPIVPLQTLDPIYVNFSVPQQDVANVPVGGTVRVTLDRASNPGGAVFAGKITALDSVVNEATRNVGVQATLANPEGRLKPGMFVQAEIPLPATRGAIALPASAINYAPYGDSVFIVADMKSPDGKPYRGVRQQIVKLGPARGDQISVLGGLEPGQEVVTSGVFKLRNGAAVVVNNKTQPGNNPAPKPEDS
ncbi:MAG TPA: efflux RND transporter periplasmic adaptor subunit [Candidatus Limnocylindrales bacterium]|nr:efflux RND transporter periplasmic adaptor subunit [Candidatus Limnocylindrales bacterium]